MKIRILFLALCAFSVFLNAQNIQIMVDATANKKAVSPYLYGRNNSLSSNLLTNDPNTIISWQLLKDAGVTIFRDNGGNNSTKYNWRRKLSSHPDWYNNVYANDWDIAASRLQQNMPTAQGIWAFQLIGKAAKTNANNFKDWDYNRSQWWEGVNQNLAGGGAPNTSGGGKALREGTPSLYLEDWPADSTTGILDYWFNKSGLNIDSTKVRYWNMDNEPEIWNGTHDDIMPTQTPAEDFMQRYFSVAKKAREKFPKIKLMGPVPANEWQWYNYNNDAVTDNGVKYPWLEFFIKRIAEEQQRTGIRLLDLIDIHYYPSTTKTEEIVQYHRTFFDKTYIYPEANGVRRVNGGWDASQNKEYIFARCQEWLAKYMGSNHGVTLAMTETGINDNISPNVTAVWYASMMGEFMRNGVEIFTPWSWQKGMWETLHLFSRYNNPTLTEATSSDETTVSAYSTISKNNDSLTIMLVNRAVSGTKTINLNLKSFTLSNPNISTLTLNDLPNTETFVSHTQNALKKSTVIASGNLLNLSLPPMSVTAVLINGKAGITPTNDIETAQNWRIYPNPATDRLTIEMDKSEDNVQFFLIDLLGKTTPLSEGVLSDSIFNKNALLNNKTEFHIPLKQFQLPSGLYFIKMHTEKGNYTKPIFLNR
jgi:Glycoside hydrolase family 44/Secretion system C-terminal sorting domain